MDANRKKQLGDWAANFDSRSRKAPAPDEIPIEYLKLLEQKNMRQLLDMYNKFYNIGEIPKS